jgi:hypothetical protein
VAAEVDQAGATPDLSQARETSSRAGAADQPIASASQPMAGDAAATGTEIAALAGYFSIPVDDILDQCKASPDSKVSDVMYRGGGGPAGIAPDQAPDE